MAGGHQRKGGRVVQPQEGAHVGTDLVGLLGFRYGCLLSEQSGYAVLAHISRGFAAIRLWSRSGTEAISTAQLIRTVCAYGLPSVVAQASSGFWFWFWFIWRSRPFLAWSCTGNLRGSGDALAGGRSVRLVRAELRVFPFEAVLAGALVVALDLPLPTRPACGAYTQ